MGVCGRRLLALPSRERLQRMLRFMLDENEFLSPHGVRSLSKFHEEHPYEFEAIFLSHWLKFARHNERDLPKLPQRGPWGQPDSTASADWMTFTPPRRWHATGAERASRVGIGSSFPKMSCMAGPGS
jgi:hypothetical protein